MRKIIIIAASCCIVLLLLGFAGFRGYKVWKETHWVSLAKTCAENGDARGEYLCLQQILRLNPKNLTACYRMAFLAETARSPSAIIWRERILDLTPNSVENRLALAQTALLLNDIMIATNTLAGVDEAGKKTAAYQNLAGVIASRMNQTDAAEQFFSEAIRLEPGNMIPQVNLAVVRLHSTNAAVVADARINLQRISETATNSTLQVQAMRELLMDAIITKNKATSLELANKIVLQKNSSFTDKLMRLDVLQNQDAGNFKSALADYQSQAATNVACMSELVNWLMNRTSPASALSWLQSLPMAAQTNQPAASLIAECFLTVKNWQKLGNTLTNQNWNEMEFMRHAYLSKAMREQNFTAGSAAEWEVALKLADAQKVTLIALFKQAAKWGWVNEAEQILWTIVNRYPEEKWASPALQKALALGGRTRPLMQLLNLQARRTPHNLLVLNDLAMTAMLLDAQEIAPFDLAKKVYDESPKTVSFASTYAYSLYLQKKNSEALAVIQKLSPQELNNPSVIGYYGLMLKAGGESAKGISCIQTALNKGFLLPEERKIFEEALKN